METNFLCVGSNHNFFFSVLSQTCNVCCSHFQLLFRCRVCVNRICLYITNEFHDNPRFWFFRRFVWSLSLVLLVNENENYVYYIQMTVRCSTSGLILIETNRTEHELPAAV
jgi:hypothetical protein